MQSVDLVVVAFLFGEMLGHRVGDDLLHPVHGEDSEPAHLGELVSQWCGDGAVGVAAAGGFGDVAGEITHPFDLLRDLDGADYQPQFLRYRGLQRQQRGGVLPSYQPVSAGPREWIRPCSRCPSCCWPWM